MCVITLLKFDYLLWRNKRQQKIFYSQGTTIGSHVPSGLSLRQIGPSLCCWSRSSSFLRIVHSLTELTTAPDSVVGVSVEKITPILTTSHPSLELYTNI